MATIKDIARKLNISTSTVSYALNGGPRSVPADVKERILQVARELQYRPNRLARTLITRRSYTVGIVPTEPSINLAMTPYFQGLLNGVLNEAERLHHDVLIFTRHNPEDVEATADMILDGRVDGVIFLAPFEGTRIFEAIREANLPHAVISSRQPSANCCLIDNFDGVRQALEHLYNFGHRRIAHVTGRMNMDDAVERMDAFQKVVMKLDLNPDECPIIEGDFCQEGGRRAAVRLTEMNRRPSAVFCANDELATGLMFQFQESGLSIPSEMSIVGFDNAPVSRLVQPAVTTVRQPLEEMGTTAIRGLIAAIEAETTPTLHMFSPELIVRASVTSPQEDP